MNVLDTLSLGAMNLHHSLLPAYRGGNPLLWQVIDGVSDIGVSVHRLSEKADHGYLFSQIAFERPPAVSKSALAYQANIEHGLGLLKTVIRDYLSGCLQPTAQPAIAPDEPAVVQVRGSFQILTI